MNSSRTGTVAIEDAISVFSKQQARSVQGQYEAALIVGKDGKQLYPADSPS